METCLACGQQYTLADAPTEPVELPPGPVVGHDEDGEPIRQRYEPTEEAVLCPSCGGVVNIRARGDIIVPGQQ